MCGIMTLSFRRRAGRQASYSFTLHTNRASIRHQVHHLSALFTSVRHPCSEAPRRTRKHAALSLRVRHLAPKIPAPVSQMEHARVVVQHAEDYSAQVVAPAIAAAVQTLGGWNAWIKRGDRVLVKPNCISGAPAEQQAQTHPAFVAEVCRQLIDFGVKPFVGDSPAWGSLPAVAARSGLTPLLQRLGVPLVEFKHPVTVENTIGHVYRHLTLDRAAMEADAIINVPKLKTHRQLYVTFAIKNMFGCVPGKRKAWWHFKAGNYENYFARMLCEVYALTRPVVTIMDSIIGQEGNGPIRGEPRQIGLVLASTDAPALERIACEIIGAEPHRVRTLRAAAELGIGIPQLDRIEVVGESIESVRIADFKFPKPLPIGFSLPRVVKSTLKNAWIIRQESSRNRQTGA